MLARGLRSSASSASPFAALRRPCTPCARPLHFGASLQRPGSILSRLSLHAVKRNPVALGLRARASSSTAAELPTLSPPAVGRWLLLSSTLVFGVIVVGGVTRLTESGLSITEWKPITGILPPLSRADWQDEFDKYKATPEFKL
jgi:hypothetical protein